MGDLLFCHIYRDHFFFIYLQCVRFSYICHLINHCIIHTYDHVHFARKCVKEVNTSDLVRKGQYIGHESLC